MNVSSALKHDIKKTEEQLKIGKMYKILYRSKRFNFLLLAREECPAKSCSYSGFCKGLIIGIGGNKQKYCPSTVGLQRLDKNIEESVEHDTTASV